MAKLLITGTSFGISYNFLQFLAIDIGLQILHISNGVGTLRAYENRYALTFFLKNSIDPAAGQNDAGV